jgi:hypothetical protein
MKRKILNVAMSGLMLSSAVHCLARLHPGSGNLDVCATAGTSITACFPNCAARSGHLPGYRQSRQEGCGAFCLSVRWTARSRADCGQSEVLFHKRSAGSSASVNPVAEATAITHMVIDNGNCTRFPASMLHVPAGDTELKISDGGVSMWSHHVREVNTRWLECHDTGTACQARCRAAAGLVFVRPCQDAA